MPMLERLPQSLPPCLTERGVYLVTGGAGGIGAVVAEYLAKRASARLIVVGRSPAGAATRRLIEALCRSGGDGAYYRADVTDRAAMTEALRKGTATFGPLDGVFHAAGVLRDRLAHEKPRDEFAAVLAPKIEGTLLLDEITASSRLRCFVLFSSITSVVGNAGQCDYAYANAFMDAWAEERNATRGPTLCVNWPAWRDGGMRVPDAYVEDWVARTGTLLLEAEEGIRALDTALRAEVAQVMPLVGDRASIERVLRPQAALPSTNATLEDEGQGEVMVDEREGVSASDTPAKRSPEEPERAAAAPNGSLTRATDAYLRGVLCTVLKLPESHDFRKMRFEEIGLDSLSALRLHRAFQKDLGPLPRTLLFEHLTLESLVVWLVANRGEALRRHFGMAAEPAGAPPAVAAPVPSGAPTKGAFAGALFEDERALAADAVAAAAAVALYDRYATETAVAIARGAIAPATYLCAGASALFHVGRKDRQLFAFSYVGAPERFELAVAELARFARDRGLSLSVLSEKGLTEVAGMPFTSTSFCVVQRLPSIQDFSLAGGPMSRLRYMATKFGKQGAGRTVPYVVGTDADTDAAVLKVIDLWLASKAKVKPTTMARFRDWVAARKVPDRHRIFLTSLDGVLQNVIVLDPLPATGGFLMDLEFYRPDMPLGGLEFGIANILETLKAEGCRYFSLGLTLGIRVTPSPAPAAEVEEGILALQREGIFSETGNFQFKSKFRPVNSQLYLCRPADAGALDVVDIIMMFAEGADAMRGAVAPVGVEADAAPEQREPARGPHDAARPEPPPAALATGGERKRTAVATNLAPPAPAPSAAARPRAPSGERAERDRVLAAHGENPMRIPAGHIDVDLLTDSWSEIGDAFVADALPRGSRSMTEDVLREVFPFAHTVLVASGRMAEGFLCRSLPRGRRHTVQNLLWPTWIYHQVRSDFEPVELGAPDARELASSRLFRGDVDVEKLETFLAERRNEVAFACVEAIANAVGGLPVSMANIARVSELLHRHGIPLVVDATRIVENSAFIAAHERPNEDLWRLTREFLGHADYVTASLTKDFGVDAGGLIATNDARVLREIVERVEVAGSGLNAASRARIGAAFADLPRTEALVRRRMAAARRLHATLKERGVPLVEPAGGHGVFIDVGRLPQFAHAPHPAQSFLAWLYRETGVRGGLHNPGLGRDTALSRLVRLALPVGMPDSRLELACTRLAELFAAPPPALHLALAQRASGFYGEAKAEFRRLEDAPTSPRPPGMEPSPTSGAAASSREPSCDIAIIGVAGRYPGAATLDAFWENLAAGADSVTSLPPERAALHGVDPEHRWGGFLADVDRFDALFFKIAPKDAELMDPQERLFLEVAWETVENAGYRPADLGRAVGVFVGGVWTMYQVAGAEDAAPGTAPNSYLWAVANRVSYVMDFAGPSMTVDTACSSSLSAIHLACKAIRDGECTAAIAGGVNLDLHPAKRRITSQGGFLSPDGRCRAFGQDANGYVAGEGVGAVLLKSLVDARRDGDRILAVIRATAVNHGGRTSGFTVPNPQAQTALVSRALDVAGVDARSISYVEAHGTGTKLGDPIEIAGLTEAFRKHTEGTQYCAIGSVKTNIGHLEAAAGIAGLTKVLLQMEHRELVPSLHADVLSDFIDFEPSPFVVQRRRAKWTAPRIDGKRQPLRASVSSFGAGGSNAHLVVEAWEDPSPRDARPDGRELLFLLSAPNEERLAVVAERLRRFLDRGLTPTCELRDVAYTLAHGRMAFGQRLAVVAATVDELKQRLDAFLAGRKDEKVHCGKKNAAAFAAILGGEERTEVLSILGRSASAARIAALWVGGAVDDLGELGAAIEGRRVALPTYPFQRVRHWFTRVGTLGEEAGARDVIGATRLHALVDENVSTVAGVRFRKRFDPEQMVIRDHVIAGLPTLPGVAYLEMVRAAAERATNRRVTRFRNVTFMRPLTAEECARDTFVELASSATTAEEFAFEVVGSDPSGARIVHVQGKVFTSAPERTPEPLDIAATFTRCRQEMTGEACYAQLHASAVCHYRAYRTIERLRVGGREAISELRFRRDLLPEGIGDMLLHPTLMDGATSTTMGLWGEAGTTHVPFFVGEVEILRPLSEHAFVHAVVAGEVASPGKPKKFHLTVADGAGYALVVVRDFTLVPLRLERPDPKPEKTLAKKPLYFASEWTEKPVPSGRADVSGLLVFAPDERARPAVAARLAGKPLVWVTPGARFAETAPHALTLDPGCAEHYARLWEYLDAKGIEVDAVFHAWSRPSPLRAAELDEQLDLGLRSVFRIARALVGRRPPRVVRVVAALLGNEPAPRAAIAGLARAVRTECPSVAIKAVGLPPFASTEGLVDALFEELTDTSDVEVLRSDTRREVKVQRPVVAPADGGSPLSRRGVYLVTGGLGGLGSIVASFLAKEYAARLVLTGRRALGDEDARAIASLEDAGAEVLYFRADISKRSDVEALVKQALDRFGRIDGVLHAAGVLRDSLIATKTDAALDAVLAPKLRGTLLLDEATAHLPLDFFLLFSSLSAVVGNFGQTDYAAANAFMDGFAAWRREMTAGGRRHGASVSVNWSLWREGGMRVSAATEELLATTWGMRPLATSLGLEALRDALLRGLPSLVVVDGDRDKLEATLGVTSSNAGSVLAEVAAPRVPDASGRQAPPGDGLVDLVVAELSALVTKLLGVPAADLDPHANMGDFGFDSLTFTDFTNRINRELGVELTPVIFFEHDTLTGLGRHLCDAYGERVNRRYAARAEATDLAGATPAAVHVAPSPMPSGPIVAPPAPEAPSALVRVDGVRTTGDGGVRRGQPVAIVGMSGKMPSSSSLAQFWEKLAAGEDFIREIPRERWDWRDYYGDPLATPNVTNSNWGAFLEDVDKFDAPFFRISRREADLMDPQQRLFLEAAWSAVEDAGYKPSDLSGTNAGLFVGAGSLDYLDVHRRNNVDVIGYSLTGCFQAIIANRASYFLNIHGPSLQIDTACSASLVAINAAVEAIQLGNCDLAIAGGVDCLLDPHDQIGVGQGGMLSPRGRCRTFDKGADGYVRGEGVGALLLKPLDRALADGDEVRAVIRGSAVGHGGRATSMTAPNPSAQSDLLVTAWTKAGIDPATASYIELHGTGTALGDPIEVTGLRKAFSRLYEQWGKPPPQRPHCALGSVKTNIGHLERAAGIAGVFKVLLAMKHGQLPKTLHLEELNPHLPLEGSPFYVVREKQSWERQVDSSGRPVPRRAGVSSFGFGGAYAHVVLEEHIRGKVDPEPRGLPRLFVLSARDPARLADYAARMAKAARDADEGLRLLDVAYTSQVGRDAMEERLALIVKSLGELADKLEAFARQGDVEGAFRARVKVAQGPKKDGVAPSAADLRAWAEAWVSGAALDWSRLYDGESPRRVSLPTYPFARERYWVRRNERPSAAVLAAFGSAAEVPPSAPPPANGSPVRSFAERIDAEDYLVADHRVGGVQILAGAAHLELARAAAESAGLEGYGLAAVRWDAALAVHRREEIRVEISADGPVRTFRISSGMPDGPTYARGELRVVEAKTVPPVDPGAVRARCLRVLRADACYALFAARGFDYGRRLQAIRSLHLGEGEALAVLELPSELAPSFSGRRLHPALVDGAIQSTIALLDDSAFGEGSPPIIAGVEQVVQAAPLTRECLVWTRQRDRSALRPTFDVTICAPSGDTLVHLEQLAIVSPARPTPSGGLSPSADFDQDFVENLARALELDRAHIRPDVRISDLGVDSLGLLRARKMLEKRYGRLPADLFVQKGTVGALRRELGERSAGRNVTDDVAGASTAATVASAASPENLQAKTVAWLRRLVATELQIDAAELAEDRPLAEYGLDSLLALRLLKAMERVTGRLPSTVLVGKSLEGLARELAPRCGQPIAHHVEEAATDAPVAATHRADGASDRASTAPVEPVEPVERVERVEPVGAGSETKLRAAVIGWLVPLLARELALPESELAVDRPLVDYGLDSLLALRILKAMERVTGRLPVTLLTQSTAESIASYLVAHFSSDLFAHFGLDAPANGTPARAAESGDAGPREARAVEVARCALVIEERRLAAEPALDTLVRGLMRAHADLGFAESVRDIAPLVFLSRRRDGLFHFHRDHERILAVASACPPEAYPRLCRELVDFGRKEGREVNILSETRLEDCDGVRFTATPFAVVQRLPDLGAFALDGSRMRRLRYMVSRFAKTASCATVEYRPGSDRRTDAEIADVIDKWCALKSKVNPCILRVRREILEGRLPAIHRVFLTRTAGALVNVVLITEQPKDRGYLMDLEFYSREMPLGGLEFAIAEITAVLKREGRTSFSLGLTFGAWQGTSSNADPAVAAALEDLRRAGLYDGSGNLQFKNKFGTTNSDFYLCRPAGSSAASVPDILMMLAEPRPLADAAPSTSSDARPSDEAATPPAPLREDAAARRRTLEEHGYSPMSIPAEKIDFDLLTDSWSELEHVAIAERMSELRTRASSGRVDVEQALRSVFPFRHLVPVTSGRMAEAYLAKALLRDGRRVVQNLLFPTWLLHQIDRSLEPTELPIPDALDPQSEHPFRGDLDCTRLARLLAEDARSVAFVCVELADNAVGGQPVSLANLRQVRALLRPHGIPLVVDATRIVENAVLIEAREAGQRGRDVWEIVGDLCRTADALTASLTKDFAVDAGGLVATESDEIASELARVVAGGGGLNATARRIVAEAALDKAANLERVRRRMAHVRAIASALEDAKVPIARGADAHCVLVRVLEMPEFASLPSPQASFAAWLYTTTGMRVGAHNAGLGRERWLSGTVRLAVPIGLSDPEVAEIRARLASALRTRVGILRLAPAARANVVSTKAHPTFEIAGEGAAPSEGAVVL